MTASSKSNVEIKIFNMQSRAGKQPAKSSNLPIVAKNFEKCNEKLTRARAQEIREIIKVHCKRV